MNRYLLETDQNQFYTEDGRSAPCKNSGQDACCQKAYHLPGRQRFQVSDQVIRDNLTGAVWSRNANPTEYPLTWNEALAYVALYLSINVLIPDRLPNPHNFAALVLL